jgi:uncharacterized alkaline shock family protein YloU
MTDQTTGSASGTSSSGTSGSSTGSTSGSTSGSSSSTSPARTGGGRSGSSDLTTSQGKTVIADVVVSTIAGIATREINGVYDLGGGAARAVGAIRKRIAGGSVNQSQGVSVEVGETQAAVDIDLVADYGVSLVDLASAIRRNVIDAIERMTGLEVTEVNITVHDVHIEGGSDDSREQTDSTPRVQ